MVGERAEKMKGGKDLHQRTGTYAVPRQTAGGDGRDSVTRERVSAGNSCPKRGGLLKRPFGTKIRGRE